MGKIMEKFTDSVARKIWNQMEEEQRKCKESKIQTITEKQSNRKDKTIAKGYWKTDKRFKRRICRFL